MHTCSKAVVLAACFTACNPSPADDPKQFVRGVTHAWDKNPTPATHRFSVPPAVDWSNAPPIAVSPARMMTGKPGFNPQFASNEFDTYKTAFTSSWTELATAYNGLVNLHSEYKAGGSNPSVWTGVHNVDTSRSFIGGTLKPSLTKIDSVKLSPELRGQIAHTQYKMKAIELDISSKRLGISNANSSLIQATIRVAVAMNNVDAADITGEIERLQLDKDQAKQDIEEFKAKVKVSMEGAKSATSHIINAKSQLATFDSRIIALQNHKAAAILGNARFGVASALEEVHRKLNDIKVAINVLELAKVARRDACREMSKLIAKAGAASGLNLTDQRAAAGSVEAMPEIETILEQLQRMDEVLVMPRYSAPSGIGAAMASNLTVFIDALSVLRGNRETVAQLKVLWGARHDSVSALVARTASATGEE